MKYTFINEFVKSVFRYNYLKASIEAPPLKVVVGSKDLASLGQSDIDMLSQFLSFSFKEALYMNSPCSYSQQPGNWKQSKCPITYSSILTGN